MTPNHRVDISIRSFVAAMFALCGFALGPRAQPAHAAAPTSITGVYNGSYAGDQGPIKFKLSITQQDDGKLAGVFTLYRGNGSDTKAYTCDVAGFIQANGTFILTPGTWDKTPPSGFEMKAGFNGRFDPAGGNGAGQISGKMRDDPRPPFDAIRDADESAKMASAPADRKNAGAPARAVAPPSSSARIPTPAAPARPSSQAPKTADPRSAVNGIYTGTYGSNPDDNVTAKLYVKFIDNGSVNGTLDGLFTFDVPPSRGAKPITYTYKLIGVSEPGNTYPFQFWSAKPLGPPAPAAYAVKGVGAAFVRGPLVRGPAGQFERITDPDQITAAVTVVNSVLSASNKFEGARDKAASANLDSLMAEQASAASAVSPTAPAALPAATGARPSIAGVFNGTYTRANEPPTKLKLTITHTAEGLGGVATIYLPTDAGTKAYTYSLKGAEDGRGAFHLFVYDWDMIPPKDFTDFKAMGFNGTFLSNVNQNTARIISVQASGNLASLCVPRFEATWDATESANLNGVIAAQKAVGNADLAAALKTHAEVLKNARPQQLASKDLVRKSQAYWDKYRSDFIREIFDGGFASDVDDDPAFQSLFTDYVDLFSKNCAAYLPAGHKTVVITTTTTRGGAVIGTTTKTVDVDSRFIPKYVEFSGVDPAPGSDQAKEQTAKTIAIVGQMFHAGGPSHGTSPADANALLHLMAAHGLAGGAEMDKFFATEVKAGRPSAALRQMGENLLRGATGEPSLQEAGGKIDGAEVETDKDVPPGRFTHFIDAAHAFYRDPANVRLKSRFETAFDETLAAKYRGVMTREEEYFYANDFGPRFRNQIMQDRSHSTDPAWARLHPAVEECVLEIH
jgi:hypothetical protein